MQILFRLVQRKKKDLKLRMGTHPHSRQMLLELNKRGTQQVLTYIIFPIYMRQLGPVCVRSKASGALMFTHDARRLISTS